jgi:IS30 family transposase
MMVLATASSGGTAMGSYGHPGIAEREGIMARRGDHGGVSRMAREAGRDRSTVSGEIARDGWQASTGRRHRACVLSTSFERKSHRFLSSIRSGSAQLF